jgi:hypothetical protein
MKLKLLPCLLVTVVLAIFAGQARADLVYSLVTDHATYNVAADGAVSVDVYLQETLTGGSSSGLVAQNGLFSFDVAVDVASAPSDPAAVTASAVNPGFNGVVNNVPPMIVIADRDLFELDGVQPTMIDATTYRVLLATFTIEGGSLLGETTTFSVADYTNPLTPGADENTFYWDDIAATNPLDAAIVAGSFDVTVIPEPASMSLLTLGGLMALRRRRA